MWKKVCIWEHWYFLSQQCRLQKLSFGPVYSLDLFSSCGAICVSRDSVPPKQDLEELITLCGGHIVASTRSACLMVGNSSSDRHKYVKRVDEKWVLDSIQFCTLGSVSEYAVWGESFRLSRWNEITKLFGLLMVVMSVQLFWCVYEFQLSLVFALSKSLKYLHSKF
jgi:hypothetical protein